MPFIPALHCAQVRVQGNQSGQICEWTFAAQFPSAPTLTNMDTLAGAVDGWFNTDLLPYTGNNVEYQGVGVRDLGIEDGFETFLSEPLEGTAAGIALPANCAGVMTKYTGVMGRSNRGRSFVWGLQEAWRADQRFFATAAETQLNDSFDNLLGVVVTAGWIAVVVSYFHDNAPRVSASIRPITSWIMRDLRIDTQRRRLGAG